MAVLTYSTHPTADSVVDSSVCTICGYKYNRIIVVIIKWLHHDERENKKWSKFLIQLDNFKLETGLFKVFKQTFNPQVQWSSVNILKEFIDRLKTSTEYTNVSPRGRNFNMNCSDHVDINGYWISDNK